MPPEFSAMRLAGTVMDTSSVNRLCSVVKALGGPDIPPAVIEAETNSAGVRDLQKWLADQFHSDPAVKRIILERDEHQLAQTASAKGHVHDGGSNAIGSSSDGYISPSARRTKNARSEQELELLQREASHLTATLKHMKVASQHLLQTRKKLEKAVQEACGQIQRHQDNLDELAIGVDSSLSRAIVQAQEVLANSAATSAVLETHSIDLRAICRIHEITLETVKQEMLQIDEIEDDFPDPFFVAQEASRLSRVLRSQGLNIPERRDELLQTAIDQELQAICESLDGSIAVDIDSLIAELSTSDNTEVAECTDADVESAIQSAWDMDCLALIRSRETVLDEAREMFDDILNRRLTELQHRLQVAVDYNLEVEARINVLLDEIEDAIGDAEEAKTASKGTYCDQDNTPNSRRAELKDILKHHADYRSQSAAPLVLLDDTDLDTELQAIKTRLTEARKLESELLKGLPSQLPTLDSALFSAVYANSPANTSRPLSAPSELAQLETTTRNHIDSMTRSIVALQKNVELNDRAQRKLKQFVAAKTSKD